MPRYAAFWPFIWIIPQGQIWRCSNTLRYLPYHSYNVGICATIEWSQICKREQVHLLGGSYTQFQVWLSNVPFVFLEASSIITRHQLLAPESYRFHKPFVPQDFSTCFSSQQTCAWSNELPEPLQKLCERLCPSLSPSLLTINPIGIHLKLHLRQ